MTVYLHDKAFSVSKLLEEVYGFVVTDVSPGKCFAMKTVRDITWKVVFNPSRDAYAFLVYGYDENGRQTQPTKYLTLDGFVSTIDEIEPAPWDGTPEMLMDLYVADQENCPVITFMHNSEERHQAVYAGPVDILDLEEKEIRMEHGHGGGWIKLKHVKFIWPFLPDSHYTQDEAE